MTAKEIINEIAKQDSLFGICAKKINGNAELEIQFIEELFDQIRKDPKNMEIYFGKELISKIDDFYQRQKSIRIKF